ncbi:MAG: hypothetical protein AAGJ83_06745, partial [Planctomycetota bacterium]
DNQDSLQQQLDTALEAFDLSWCDWQTVLIVSSKHAISTSFAEVRLYRIPTPRRDYSSVMTKLQEIAPQTWEALGGHGVIVPLVGIPSAYAIRQSPLVHRQIATKLKRQPTRLTYSHPFDSKAVTVSANRTTYEELLTSIADQLNVSIELTPSLRKIGLDLANLRKTIQLKNISAADALDLLLRELVCTWVIDGNVILIQSLEEAESNVAARQFSIKPSVPDGDGMMDLMQTCVRPDSWEVFGGMGSLTVVRPGRYLIRQGQPAMREVEQFITTLNSLR